MDNALTFLGMARRAGFLEIGEELSSAAMLNGRARLVLTARDAAENTLRRVEGAKEYSSAVCVALPYSKEELGIAVGKNMCAVVAITDMGMAASMAKKLSGSGAASQAETELLAAKAQRALVRKKRTRTEREGTNAQQGRPHGRKGRNADGEHD